MYIYTYTYTCQTLSTSHVGIRQGGALGLLAVPPCAGLPRKFHGLPPQPDLNLLDFQNWFTNFWCPEILYLF